MNNYEEKLTRALLQAGASPQTFSINNPRKYVLNFQQEGNEYSVWFQNADSVYEKKTYPSLGQAVYEFAARLVPGFKAREIAREFGDENLPVYD